MPYRAEPSRGFVSPKPDDLKAIITDAGAAQTLDRVSDGLGQALAQPLATSQIRSLYGEVIRIKANWLENRDSSEQGRKRKERARRAFILLKPKMAYRAKKESGKSRGVEDLVSVLLPAMEYVSETPKQSGETIDDNFRRFVEFFEAILAYHRAYGGK
jgi:CRISPR-associated protein Csm2